MNSNIHQKYATFFISTGRCATQWFAKSLATHYHDLAIVRHEPLQMEYQTRYYFRAYHRNEKVEFSKAIRNHLAFVGHTIENYHYIEAGWPVYGVLPFILSQLKGRVKLVHLYRNPMRVAASLATHRVYNRAEWAEELAISPDDDGVVQSYLARDQWNSMSEFEKCLFWWTEVNHFALAIHRNFATIPWLSLKYEHVFSENGRNELSKLLDFLCLPERDDFLNSRTKVIDAYSLKTDRTLNIDTLRKYPKVFDVMGQLGYEYDDRITSEIKKRYEKTFFERWKIRSLNAIRSLMARIIVLIKHRL